MNAVSMQAHIVAGERKKSGWLGKQVTRQCDKKVQSWWIPEKSPGRKVN